MSKHVGPGRTSLLNNFRVIFYVCKLCGLSPYDWHSFQREGQLKISKWSICTSVAIIILQCVLYDIMILVVYDDIADYNDKKFATGKSNLNYVIGVILAHIDVVLLAIDGFNIFKNNHRLAKLFQYIAEIDERFYNVGHIMNNKAIEYYSYVLITLASIFEIIVLIEILLHYIDYTQWSSYLWLVSCIPSFYNTLDKIWYVMLLNAIKLRFEALNEMFNDLSKKSKTSQKRSNLNYIKKEERVRNEQWPSRQLLSLYLCKDINVPFSRVHENQEKQGQQQQQYRLDTKESIYFEEKHLQFTLNCYCQLHTDLCEICQMLNDLWNLSFLLLFGYEFLCTVALLYFIYCAGHNQEIPEQFSLANNLLISILYLFYNGSKCFYIIYLCCECSKTSKYNGIYLHRFSLELDCNFVYDTVNHISLKLLHSSINPSAFGLFKLNMKTLYSMAGSITTYLIILIQFNIAAQQQKHPFKHFSQNYTYENSTN